MVVSTEAGPENEPDHLRSADLSALYSAAAVGDQAAWDELVHRLQGLIWSICRSFRLNEADAADAFQLTWLRLLNRFDTITDPQKLASWLATTCRRECLALYRMRTRVVSVGDDDVLDRLSVPVAGADTPAIVGQRNAAVWEAFFMLGEECQRILWVLVVDPPEHHVYHVAAEHLAMPTGSLGPKRGRCLTQMKRHLTTMGISDAGDAS